MPGKDGSSRGFPLKPFSYSSKNYEDDDINQLIEKDIEHEDDYYPNYVNSDVKIADLLLPPVVPNWRRVGQAIDRQFGFLGGLLSSGSVCK